MSQIINGSLGKKRPMKRTLATHHSSLIAHRSSFIATHHSSLVTHRVGFTLVEILVIIGIISILCAISISAYAKMQANQRLSQATDRVMSTLRHARSLAISNNAIYHIRLRNWDYDKKPEVPTDRTLSIHCYPKINEAIGFVNEPIDDAHANAWSPHSPFVNATGTTIINPECWKPPLPPPPQRGIPYNNYRLTHEIYEKTIYFGIQSAFNANSIPKEILSFYPEGTASDTMTIFVTDDKTLGNVSYYKTPENVSDKLELEELHKILNNKRWDAFNKLNPRIKIIQIYKGGMVKLLKPGEL
ncbi:MAG: hypothetical protein V1899_11470 [Planctomycetota bacterium]